ncbi:MAG: hypothetical protein OJF61_000062 [Rhodanobacteraceae bacterium]|nr:MAG: hypothetical protein OJF61_000062 [Rhodanobacteraceae bacterium]
MMPQTGNKSDVPKCSTSVSRNPGRITSVTIRRCGRSSRNFELRRGGKQRPPRHSGASRNPFCL